MSKNTKLVFVISNSPFIGTTIEAYIAIFNSIGKFNLNPQKVNSKTVSGYSVQVSDVEFDVLRLIYHCEEEEIVHKFSTKKMKVPEFFKSIDEKKFRTLIRPNIEGYLNKALALISLYNLQLFTINKSHDEVFEKPLDIQSGEADVHFRFVKHDFGISYRLKIKHGDSSMHLFNQNVVFITHKPCWIIFNNTLLHFDEEIDSQKLIPFTHKEVIEIPNTSVDIYIQNFIQKIFRKFDVEAEGIELITESPKPIAILNLDYGINSRPIVALSFDYEGNMVLMSKNQHAISECLVEDGVYTLRRILRNLSFEFSIVDQLHSIGLRSFENVHFFYPSPIDQANIDTTDLLINTICLNYDKLISLGIQIRQNLKQVNYFFGQVAKTTQVKEHEDWFDVDIQVTFGQFKIPFVMLRNNILNKINEFKLPDGSIALIPNEWFGEYSELVQFSTVSNNKFKVKKYHFNVISNIEGTKNININDFYKKVAKLDLASDILVPSNLNAQLRSYQYLGYKWLKLLEEQKFSGCLADDMGLGKTIQAIAVLLETHNRGNVNTLAPQELVSSNTQIDMFNRASTDPGKFAQASLIVMPLSLIFNWQQELLRFAPSLLVYIHSGLYRSQSASVFHLHDIILTTYGMVRNDIELFKKYNFNYVVLDESQNIRNPQSKAYRAVRSLQSNYKLALTGTPIENSLVDLWAQVNFLNPGLLGGLKQFRKNYVLPIEKQNNTEAKDKLKKILQPFFMRRTKDEVAPELPSLTEVIHYCDMSEEQNSAYENIKSSVRNSILFSMSNNDRGKLNIMILRGLMQLRLASIHPKLLDPSFEFLSGKHIELREIILQILQEDHKILIFSQFVRHLKLVLQFPELEHQKVLMLTGMTPESERQNIVNEFQQNKDSKVLLMTLKAGGVGLNLTAADYILLIDPWWNPAAESQAIARAHRIGQDKKVFAYRFITKDSIEEKILILQERKRTLANEFIQNSNPLSAFSNQDLLDLFQ
ncbi:MAG: DEAD/DEAH box helicase [Bacteroidota bacterium]